MTRNKPPSIELAISIIKQSVFLSQEQWVFLEKKAGLKGLTVNDMGRRIIDEYMDKIELRNKPTVINWPKRPDGTNMAMGEWNDKKEQ